MLLTTKSRIGFVATSVILLSLLVASCHSTSKITKEVPVYVHDTFLMTKVAFDSVYVDRWHNVYVSGDTVYRTDSVIRYRLVREHDTVYQSVEKPVVTTITEVKEVKVGKPWYFWVVLVLVTAIVGGVVFFIGFIGYAGKHFDE